MPHDFTQSSHPRKSSNRKFVNRQDLIDTFWDRVKSVRPELQSVLYFHGVGGIGKSSLLGELKRQLREVPHAITPRIKSKLVAWADVDLQLNEYKQVGPALLRLRNGLVSTGDLSTPIFDLAYTHFHLCLNGHEMAGDLSSGLLDKLDNGEQVSEILTAILEEVPYIGSLFKGAALAFKSSKLLLKGKGLSDDGAIKRDSKQLRSFLWKRDPVKLSKELVDIFATEVVNNFSEDRPIVVFVDSYAAVIAADKLNLSHDLESLLWIERLCAALPGVIFTIAGRRKLEWGDSDKDWIERNLLQSFCLNELHPQYAEEFLSNADIPEVYKNAILKGYNGLPFFLDLALDLYDRGVLGSDETQLPPDIFSGNISAIIERLLSYLTIQEQATIKLLSAATSFDFELFKELVTHFRTGYPQDIDSYTLLLKSSLVVTLSDSAYIHTIAQKFLSGGTQRSARVYLLDRATDRLDQIDVKQFPEDAILHLEEGFSQVRKLKDPLAAIEWLQIYNSLFEQAGRLDLLGRIYYSQYSILTRERGEDDAATLTAQNNLGVSYISSGDFRTALPIFENVLDKRRELFGNDDQSTLNSLNLLGHTLHKSGDYERALHILTSCAEHSGEVLGPSHRTTLTAQNNLALLLEDKGNFSEACPIYERTFELQVETLGADHIETLTTLNNLAYCYGQTNQIAKSEAAHKYSLAGHMKTLGPHHPATLSVANNCAMILEDYNNIDEAREIFEHVLEQRRLKLGIHHPDTLNSLNNLAECLKSNGHANNALPLFEEASRRREQVQGSTHPDTLQSYNNEGLCLSLLGRHKEAYLLLDKTIKTQKEIIGANHPQTLTTEHNLAGCLSSLGRFSEAEARFREVWIKRIKVHGGNHPWTLSSSMLIANCLVGQHKYEMAVWQYCSTLQTMYDHLGSSHQYTISAWHALNSLCQSLINIPKYRNLLYGAQMLLNKDLGGDN